MKVLIGCEFSGRVRNAFLAAGHDAYSCDLRPCEVYSRGRHIRRDILEVIGSEWEMLIAFPPCDALALSGNRWYAGTTNRDDAIDFVRALLNAPIRRIALENPKGVISTEIRPPSQIIHPYEYGDPWKKGTCLWLKNLPRLKPTKMVIPTHNMHEHARLSRDRQRTFPGIAKAMAEQWGSVNGHPTNNR